MDIDLFTPIVSTEKMHFIFKTLLEPSNAPEKNVLHGWAKDFIDRDNKFIQEFQTTFESSMWELYLNAALTLQHVRY
ncbi:MAG: hypothetical protein JSS07_01085 [Proteobacteria bacterium]|nr:hypothetical protein [Pseudomonadota bacterium]